ncbi:hypothetical protein D3C80_1741970 [compost metagenome]
MRLAQILAFSQHLQAEGGRRQGQAQAQHNGCRQRLAKQQVRQQTQDHGGQPHLQRTHAEQ